MKKLLLILSGIVFLGCNKNDDNVNCNFLFDAGVNLTVNTNLPQFNQLQFPGNGVFVSGQGNNGIWLWRLNSSILYAWDAADPSHEPSACSTIEDTGNGDIVECGCEDANQYSLATGLGFGENTQPCTLKPYRVEAIGNNTFFVSN
ncbi:hypothetical protein [uncultured Winogradskyella sp.]|uniref:hypothetical protein n=1 Tax=uncultured Winogradskyella sp. TaxID=395353 RepID=UPI0030DB8F9F|tara:strand:- start:9912 stop:10349 length:438 start_codon:yes stop_codon:yes gene_type:complete